MLKPPSSQQQQQQQQQQQDDGAGEQGGDGSGSGNGSGTPAAIGGGLVRVDVAEAVTKQLARHAQYTSHGPGLPTALAIHPSFVAVGTRRGLVLLFDPAHGAVKAVLGSTTAASTVPPGAPTTAGSSSSSSSSSVPTTSATAAAAADAAEAVTALDVSRVSGQEHFLVAGHASGRVVLWDTAKGSALKALPDAHAAPLVGVRFATTLASPKDPAVVSVDAKGHVAKLSYSRTLWGAWAVDTECLLDGKAGAIPALAVLGPAPAPAAAGAATAGATAASSSFSLNPLRAVASAPAAATTTTGPSGGGAAPHQAAEAVPASSISLIAISSERSSFVVSVEPMVKVLHKWERPQALEQQHATPALAWTWAPRKEASSSSSSGSSAAEEEGEDEASVASSCTRVHVPLLARVWGRRLQLLRAILPSTTSSGKPCRRL